MSQEIESALQLKGWARTAREADKLDEALDYAKAAVDQLDELWRAHGPSALGKKARIGEPELVTTLADTYGILGGIHRSRKDYASAVEAYDQGLGFEAHAALEGKTSYNLVQRLANRALLRPADVGAAVWKVERVDMWDALRHAAQKLGEQIAGERARDPWAAADLVLVRLLLAPETSLGGMIEKAWQNLESLSPKPFVYESTRRALEDLRKAMGSVSPAQRSEGWNEVKKWLDSLTERFRAAEESAKTRDV